MKIKQINIAGLSHRIATKIGNNYIFCCDVSGSMYDALRKMRNQLKNKIPTLLSPDDTISIIWFSGRGKCGILFEMFKVSDVSQLQKLTDAIDKFLVPQGLTNFADPLNLTFDLINRIKADNSLPVSFSFLSDGYNNDCAWEDVVASVDRVSDLIDIATVIEYGFYADTARLTEMAEQLGGTKINCPDFDTYDLAMDRVLQSKSSGRLEIDIKDIKSSLVNQFLFSYDPQTRTVSTYSTARSDKVQVPRNLDFVYGYSTGSAGKPEDWTQYLALIYIFAERGQYNRVEEILAELGDVELIQMYTVSYGKQRLLDFRNRVLDLVFDPTLRFSKGQDFKFVPNDNSFCALDLVDALCGYPDNKILPYHPSFSYNRMSAKSVTKKVLSPEETAKLVKAGTLQKATAILDKVEVAEFFPADIYAGYSVGSLTWNESRANLSMLFTIPGKVSLPKNPHGLDEVPSTIYRNYNLIKDGILNITQLVCRLHVDTIKKIQDYVVVTDIGDGLVTIDFSSIPITNKSRTLKVEAKVVATMELTTLVAQSDRKYLGYLKKALPKSDKAQEAAYSKEISDYLVSLGITSRGFSPKTELVESEDFYLACSLVTKIKSFSSLPKIEDVLKKVAAGKSLTPSETLINESIKSIDTLMAGLVTPVEKAKFIESHEAAMNTIVRNGLRVIAQSKFSLILSRRWFKDLKPDENTVLLSMGGHSGYEVSFDWKDEKVKL